VPGASEFQQGKSYVDAVRTTIEEMQAEETRLLDQRTRKLRKPSDPLDPSNRRITLIVQYIVKNDEERDRPSGSAADVKSMGSEPAEH
jgi:hypothetical protein